MLRKSSQSQSAGKRSQHARSMPLALCTLLMCASFDNTWTTLCFFIYGQHQAKTTASHAICSSIVMQSRGNSSSTRHSQTSLMYSPIMCGAIPQIIQISSMAYGIPDPSSISHCSCVAVGNLRRRHMKFLARPWPFRVRVNYGKKFS